MHQVLRRGWVGIAGALPLAWVLGCGEAKPPATNSEARAKVSGSVTVDGKKVNKGEITFDPTNINRKAAPVAQVKIDGGKYEVETLVGPNTITVSSPEIKRLVGSNYEVKDGPNQLDLDLKSSGR